MEVAVTNSDEVEKKPEGEESPNREISENKESIVDIDAYLDNAPTTTVAKLLGSPSFRDVSEVPETELDMEVDRILDLLLDHEIEVDLGECSPAEAYRFLTVEIMAEEIEDPPAPGWGTVFLYGLMHPRED